MDSNDSNDFSGAYEFGEKKDLYICKIDDIHIHDEEKSHSLQMHQLSAIKAAWVYRAWQFCSCLSLSSKSSCFSVCRLKCANDVDHSDWRDVLEMSQVFQSLLFLLRSLLMTLAGPNVWMQNLSLIDPNQLHVVPFSLC